MPSTHSGRAPRGAPTRSGTAVRSRSRRRWAWAAAVAAAVLLGSTLVALRGPSGEAAGTDADAAPAIQLTSTGGGSLGDQAPQFTAATTTGSSFALPAGKPAVVFFMAGWCASCYPEAQALARIQEQYGDKLAILAVSPDPSDSLPAIREFAERAGARYGFAHDATGTLAQALGVRALDTTVVVDAAGRVVYRDGYPTDERTLRSALSKAGLA